MAVTSVDNGFVNIFGRHIEPIAAKEGYAFDECVTTLFVAAFKTDVGSASLRQTYKLVCEAVCSYSCPKHGAYS